MQHSSKSISQSAPEGPLEAYHFQRHHLYAPNCFDLPEIKHCLSSTATARILPQSLPVAKDRGPPVRHSQPSINTPALKVCLILYTTFNPKEEENHISLSLYARDSSLLSQSIGRGGARFRGCPSIITPIHYIFASNDARKPIPSVTETHFFLALNVNNTSLLPL